MVLGFSVLVFRDVWWGLRVYKASRKHLTYKKTRMSWVDCVCLASSDQ